MSENIINKTYKLRELIFVIILIALIILYFVLNNYFNIQTVSIISFFGMIIVVIGFYLIDKAFKINFKKRHYLFIIIMAVAAITLSFLYFKYPYFDKIQHFFFPMMYASMVFYIVSKLKLNKKYTLVFVFFIVVATSGLFEILEYLIDITLNWRLQGVFIVTASGQFITIMSRIDDTMLDMITATLGTIVYIISILIIDKIKK